MKVEQENMKNNGSERNAPPGELTKTSAQNMPVNIKSFSLPLEYDLTMYAMKIIKVTPPRDSAKPALPAASRNVPGIVANENNIATLTFQSKEVCFSRKYMAGSASPAKRLGKTFAIIIGLFGINLIIIASI